MADRYVIDGGSTCDHLQILQGATWLVRSHDQVRLVDAECLHRKLGQRGSVGADPIEEHRQIAAVEGGGDAACPGHDRCEGDLDENRVSAVKVASQGALLFGAVDYRAKERGDPVARLVYAVLA